MTIWPEQLGEPVDARPLMRMVRARLEELVSDLDDADWRRSTVCPGWDVADLVAHLVGDDLGRLSRTHDGASGPPCARARTCRPTSTASTTSGWWRCAG